MKEGSAIILASFSLKESTNSKVSAKAEEPLKMYSVLHYGLKRM